MWAVRFSSEAERYLDRQDRVMQKRIGRRLKKILENPYTAGKPLRGEGGLRSARVSGLRILYLITESESVVDIKALGPRGQIYRRL